jgi:hypothetical protein
VRTKFFAFEKSKEKYFSFYEKHEKVFFVSLLAQRNETKKCAGSHAAGPLMPLKAANFIHECVR